MGMTVAFYSANPQEVAELFQARDAAGDLEAFFQKLDTYLVADFSFHLHLPEDLDTFCRILGKRGHSVPSFFSDVLVEQLWNDGIAESLTLLSANFAHLLATLSEQEIEQVALEWAATFPYQEPLEQTSAYHSLLRLRTISCDASTNKHSLLFYLDGNPAFFRW